MVQGMNFLALALLDACKGDDEKAFWVLVGMCMRLDLEVRKTPPKSIGVGRHLDISTSRELPWKDCPQEFPCGIELCHPGQVAAGLGESGGTLQDRGYVSIVC